jgi:hypothetical protein
MLSMRLRLLMHAHHAPNILKGHGYDRIFGGFCINRYGLGPLHYISSRTDFGFEFAEIFVFKKRLPVSLSRGVDKIAWSINFFQTFK